MLNWYELLGRRSKQSRTGCMDRIPLRGLVEMKTIAIIITVCAVFLTWAYWGEPESFGWLVAVTGWIDKCFEE